MTETSSDAQAGITRVDHVAVAVSSMSEALQTWQTLLDKESPDGEEEVASEKVRVAFFEVGETRFELLESMDPTGPIAAFIEKRGPGIHHVCLKVEGIETMIQRLTASGFRFVGDAPRPGAGGCQVAFIHPKSTGGVLIELSEGGSH